jgi:hypothetical protein
MGRPNETANQKGPRIPRRRASWCTHNATRKNAMYNPRRRSQKTVGDVGAAAWNGKSTKEKASGEMVPPARSAQRAA